MTRQLVAGYKLILWQSLLQIGRPYRFGFNNPVLNTDVFGLFETEFQAREYAKDNGIKIRPKSFLGKLFTSGSRSKIVENPDGTFSIDNARDHSSISDLGEGIGVVTGALVSPTDIVSTSTEGNIVFGYTDTYTLRDGSEYESRPITGTEYLTMLAERSDLAADMINGIMPYSKSIQSLKEDQSAALDLKPRLLWF